MLPKSQFKISIRGARIEFHGSFPGFTVDEACVLTLEPGGAARAAGLTTGQVNQTETPPTTATKETACRYSRQG